MHLIERYALSTGLEIDNPTISEQFFPTSCQEYVCFHASSKDNLRDYDYWMEVKKLLDPYFNKLNIKTLQIGLEKDPSLSCDIDLRGKTNMRQMSYIVKNCNLFIGVDSFPAHLAGFFNRKMVSIYSNSFAACVRPYWGEQSNQKIIETERPNGEKPSFSFNENPKTVNRIKPEKIANSALELLGLDPVKHKTIFMGEMCRQQQVEVIPKENTDIVSDHMTVRMDMSHNEDVLRNIIQRNNVEVILKEPISEDVLATKKIKKILYKSDNFDSEFISKAKKHGVSLGLICTEKENIPKLRADFFDLFVHECNEDKIIEQNKDRFDCNLNGLKIKSGKKVVCGDKTYETIYEFNGEENKDEILLDLDWLFIYSDNDE